jgi:hypothetical protein
VLASTSLREEGVERVVLNADGLVRRHGAVRLDAMLQTEELPAGVTDLDAGLTDVDGDHLTHVVVLHRANSTGSRRKQEQNSGGGGTQFESKASNDSNGNGEFVFETFLF